MHRRQLLILHGGLALAAVLLGWRLAGEWRRANLRYAAISQPKVAAAVSLPPSLSERTPAETGEIVAKNPFSPDRNNDVVLETKPLAVPPVPVVFGTMKLGASYEALMAEGGKPGNRVFRRVKPGEQFGAYTVVEIRDEKVVVEWEGQPTTLDVYQSASTVPRADARTTEAPTTPVVEAVAAPQPPPQPAASTQPAGSAAATATAAPPVADPYLKITIEGNRRKYERQTIFGTQVWYEDIQK